MPEPAKGLPPPPPPATNCLFEESISFNAVPDDVFVIVTKPTMFVLSNSV